MRVSCLLTLGLLLVPSPVAAQGFKWWQSAEVQRVLRLTPAQVAALEGIFEATLPERRALRTDLDLREFELEQLLKAPDPDDRVAVDLVDRIEKARARRNIARTMLLLRMRRVLTAAQRTALDRLAGRRH